MKKIIIIGGAILAAIGLGFGGYKLATRKKNEQKQEEEAKPAEAPAAPAEPEKPAEPAEPEKPAEEKPTE